MVSDATLVCILRRASVQRQDAKWWNPSRLSKIATMFCKSFSKESESLDSPESHPCLTQDMDL